MHIKKVTLSAMFIAIIFVSISVFSVPYGFGVIHFGDSLIYLVATILPFPFNILVAAIGPGLFNLFYVPHWLPFTIVIKPIMAMCFTTAGSRILGSKQNKIAPFLAGAINTVLYFLGNIILFDLSVAWSALPGLLIQAAGSIVFFFIFAYALDKSGVKKWILFKIN